MKTYRGAGIAFFRQKDGQYEVFLGKRKHGPIGKGKWSFPGGGMASGDRGDFLATAKRETGEEMRLNVDNLTARRLDSIRYDFSIPFFYEFHWETFLYFIEAPKTADDFKFYQEMDPWGWFPLSSLPAMQSRNELFDFMGVSVMSAVEKFQNSIA